MAGQRTARAEDLVEGAHGHEVGPPERHVRAMADVPGNWPSPVLLPRLAVLEREIDARPAAVLVRQHATEHTRDLGVIHLGLDSAQPAWVDDAVVVCERNHVAKTLRDSIVAAARQADSTAVNVANPRINAGQATGQLAGDVVGALIDHDDLEGRMVERDQRPQRGFDHRSTVASGDNDRDGGPAAHLASLAV